MKIRNSKSENRVRPGVRNSRVSDSFSDSGLWTPDCGLRTAGRGRGASRGFTLLELILAVAIFAIVLTAMHTVFFAALRLRNRAAESIDRSVPLQQTLTIIKRDLANLAVPGGTLSGALQTTPTISASNSLTSPASGSQLNGPQFYTAAGLLDRRVPWGEIERVSYFLAEPTNDAPGMDLHRAVTRNLLPVATEETQDHWLMGGVESIHFQFFDGNAWLDTWDSTATDTSTGLTNQLPGAIKVQIQLAEGRTHLADTPIELIVPIMVQARTNQTAQTSGGGE